MIFKLHNHSEDSGLIHKKWKSALINFHSFEEKNMSVVKDSTFLAFTLKMIIWSRDSLILVWFYQSELISDWPRQSFSSCSSVISPCLLNLSTSIFLLCVYGLVSSLWYPPLVFLCPKTPETWTRSQVCVCLCKWLCEEGRVIEEQWEWPLHFHTMVKIETWRHAPNKDLSLLW